MYFVISVFVRNSTKKRKNLDKYKILILSILGIESNHKINYLKRSFTFCKKFLVLRQSPLVSPILLSNWPTKSGKMCIQQDYHCLFHFHYHSQGLIFLQMVFESSQDHGQVISVFDSSGFFLQVICTVITFW